MSHYTPTHAVAVLPITYLLSEICTTKPLDKPYAILHHELRAGGNPPSVAGSQGRMGSHQGHLDDRRPTPVAPEFGAVAS